MYDEFRKKKLEFEKRISMLLSKEMENFNKETNAIITSIKVDILSHSSAKTDLEIITNSFIHKIKINVK